jgi:5'-3' exoribonuclease 2
LEIGLLQQDGVDNLDDLKLKLKSVLREKADVLSGGGEVEDSVRLGEPGWKERYYEEKFQAKSPDEMEEIQQDVVCNFCTMI